MLYNLLFLVAYAYSAATDLEGSSNYKNTLLVANSTDFWLVGNNQPELEHYKGNNKEHFTDFDDDVTLDYITYSNTHLYALDATTKKLYCGM